MAEKINKMIEKSVLKLFQLDSFKEFQIQAIENLLNGRDVFVSQPTGSGKSVIFQSLPFFVGSEVDQRSTTETTHGTNSSTFMTTKKCVLVISPLQSLVKDQMSSLKARGIKSINLGDESIDIEVVYSFYFFIIRFFITFFIAFGIL